VAYLDQNFRQLSFSGTTPEGKRVLAGVFPVVNSEGIGFDLLLEVLHELGWVIDWLDLFRAAKAFGWRAAATLSKIRTALDAIEGPTAADVWLPRAQTLASALDWT